MVGVRTIEELIVPVELYEDIAAALTPRFVKFSSDGVVAKISATVDVAAGILLKLGAAGLAGEIKDLALPGAGIQEITLGDTVAFGADVTHDSVGRAVTAVAGDEIHGTVLAGGVVGDIVPMLYRQRGVFPSAEVLAVIPSVAGTVEASKLVLVGANKNVDTLVVADGGLKLGSGAGTPVGATAAELNKADLSAVAHAITEAGAITLGKRLVNVAGGTGYAITLAAPTATELGDILQISLISIASGAVTLALTNVVGGTAASSASFDAAGETLILQAVMTAPATYKWCVTKEHGVTLS